MKKYSVIIVTFLAVFLIGSNAISEIVERAKFSLSEKTPKELRLRAGDTVMVPLSITIDKGWHGYDLQQEERNKKSPMGMGPQALLISSRKSVYFKIGKVIAPKSEIGYDSTFEVKIGEYHGKVTFQIPVIAKKNLKVGSYNDSIEVNIQVCTDEGICTNLDKLFPIKIIITAEAIGGATEPEEQNTSATTVTTASKDKTHECYDHSCDCNCDLCIAARKQNQTS
ncbi:MAG: protein-disulfide reductase DsbD N-terminal domain-containing protein, partial [Bacteroidetes bacterium]|nr:protein-disulfide reductase DsbD N-terminal domain-containing protein [Bacteroidota bacterium]